MKKILTNQTKLIRSFLLGLGVLAAFLFLGSTVLAAEFQVTGRVVLPNGNACTDTSQVQVCLWPDFPCSGNSGCGGCNWITADGTFSITMSQTGQFRAQTQVSQDYTYTSSVTKIVNFSNAANIGDLTLTTPNLQGTVVASDGVTLQANVQINVNQWNSNVNFNANTNASGLFRLGGLANGEYNVSFSPPQESTDTRTEMKVTITDANTLKDLGTVRLETPNVIGRVVHPDGSALIWQETGQPGDIHEDANINIYNQDRTVQKNANTDREGYFRIGTLPSGSYTLEIRSGWQTNYTNAAPQTITVVSGTLLNVGAIQLTNPQLTGYAYQADGTTPLANVFIEIYKSDRSFSQNTNTNSSGFYQLGGIPSGEYRLRTNSPWDRPDLAAPDETAITIPATGVVTRNFIFSAATKTLSGRVVKDNGEAVTQARINANKQSTGGHSEATVDQNGNYTLLLTGGMWSLNVSPNTPPGQSVDWVSSGPQQSVEFANNTALEAKTLDFNVQRATATVKGRVVLSNGTPITAGNVDVRNQEGRGNGQQINLDGTFSLRVPSGSYRLHIQHPENRYSFPERELSVADNQTLDLGNIQATERNAHIQGLITKKNGTPLAGIRLNANKQMEPGWSNATSASDGTFDILVDIGRWNLNVDQNQDSPYVYDGEPIDREITSANQTVSGITLALTYADVTISGSVVDSQGQTVRSFCSFAYARPVAISSFGRMQEYGGPVNCQDGTFSFHLPSSAAAAFYLGVHTPPNSEYSAAPEQNIAVTADSTITANIIVLRNDASISGYITDQTGAKLTTCDFHGQVNAGTQQDWRGTDIRSDCTYSISLLGGHNYNLNYWISEGQGYMNGNSRPTEVDVPAGGQVTKDIIIIKADARITGKILTPAGTPLSAGWVDAGNWPEIPPGTNGPSEEDMKKEIHAGTQIQSDGTFTLNVLSNHLYVVHINVPPDTNYLPSEDVQVDLTGNKTSATLELTVRAALGRMTGRVDIGGLPVNIGYVHCWGETGGGTGGPIANNGSYSLNYAAGVWHCGADSFNGTTFYKSAETTITITNQTSLTQNFMLLQSIFQVPPAKTVSFDAGNPQVIILDNGTTINIPASAMGSSGTTISVTAQPTVDMIHTQLDRPFGVGYSLTAQDSENSTITAFNSNVTITFYYTDQQLQELGLTEGTLVSKYYDEANNTWMSPTGVIQDLENNSISISTNHFTKFAIVSSGGTGSFVADAVVKNKRVLLATPDANGGPQVRVLRNSGDQRLSFMAYDSHYRGTFNTAMGDINGDGTEEIIVAPGPGFGPQVKVFNQQGRLLYSFMAYASTFRGGVSVAAGDVDNDGKDEIVTLPQSAGGSNCRIFGLKNGSLVPTTVNFFIFPERLRGGFDLTLPDLEGDGPHEVVAAPLAGGSSQVQVFGYRASTHKFQAVILGLKVYPEKYHGGIVLDKGDVDNDGAEEIFTGAYSAGGPHVCVLYRKKTDGKLHKLTPGFMAFDPGYRGGIHVAATDINNDNKSEIAVSVRAGQKPTVKLFSYDGSEVYAQFYAYSETFMGGVKLGSGSFASAD